MIGEVTAFLALGLLDRTGLFELKPPFVLRAKQQFPDCAALLEEKKVGKFPAECSVRYVNLCRLTGLAWSVWIGMLGLAIGATALIAYHAIKYSSQEVFESMGAHIGILLGFTLLNTDTFKITCLAAWCLVAGMAVLMAVYYSVLLASCRESEAKLTSAIRRPRKIAAASQSA
jgi:hypothetical protein